MSKIRKNFCSTRFDLVYSISQYIEIVNGFLINMRFSYSHTNYNNFFSKVAQMTDNNVFWNRFYSLCVASGSKPNPVAEKLNISSGILTKWKNGSIPSSDILLLVAEHFGVSVDYLLGRTEKPELNR